ncbi:MAG: hypothetical protein LUH22_03660 [Bacteroides sp.]|nr:hypothetical protein [Bacteroides sp.]
MRTNLKYSILWIFILILGSVAMQASSQHYMSVPSESISCYEASNSFSTSRNSRRSIDRLYHDSIFNICDDVSIGSLHIPVIKSFTRFTQLYKTVCSEKYNQQKSHLSFIPPQLFFSTSYYVFGLRKIII